MPIIRPTKSKHEANALRLARRRAHKRNTAAWKRLAAVVKARDGCCLDCGTTHDLTVHLHPDLAGQHDLATPDDCLTLCRSCHGAREGGRVRLG